MTEERHDELVRLAAIEIASRLNLYESEDSVRSPSNQAYGAAEVVVDTLLGQLREWGAKL